MFAWGIAALISLSGALSGCACHDQSGKSSENPAGAQAALDGLRAELLRLREVDQTAREASIERPGDASISAELADIDRYDTEFLASVVDKHGWPGKSLVGEEAAAAAWLLIQHSNDLAFQVRCLDLMRGLPQGEVDPVNLAYLEDRVLMHQGKRQIYGTQFHEVNGVMELYPVEDEGQLDARRDRLGLPSMSEYRRQILDTYEHSPSAASGK